MEIKFSGKGRYIFILQITLMIGFSSCRITREMPAERLRPMSSEKILKQVEQNTFDYNNLTIRRINVQFSNRESRTSFRASLKAVKDDKILVSISKVNIPAGRVLLTPDSVKYVNYIDRNFFKDDYTFLSRLLNFHINFNIVQSVISNSVVKGTVLSPYGSDSKDQAYQKFETFVEGGRYVLQSVNSRGVPQTVQGNNSLRRNRQIFDGGEEAIVQKLYFNPRNFNLEKIVLDDRENNWKLEVTYNDFEKVEKKNYPGSIDMKMSSPSETIELKIRLNGISAEKTDAMDLNIPGGYEQIGVN